MHRMRPPRLTAVLVVSALAAASAIRARAADDGDAAAALVATLDKDTAHGAVIAEAVGHAKDALERATRFRAVGDELHARAAEGLAREWTETARDLVKAVDAETAASDVRRKAMEAQARLERSRALVEDGITRVGRLRAELQGASGQASKDRAAVERHDGTPPGAKKDVSKSPRSDDAARGGKP